MPSSSASSRISVASGVSPASTLPPGNSHSPAIDLPGGRWASSTRPSASISATAATSTTGGEASAAVAGIDVDIAVGQIAGPHRRLAAADADIDGDLDFATAHMGSDRRLVIAWYRTTISEDRQIADRDSQAIGIDLFAGLPHRHDDAAPIGVAGRKCGLDQWRVADRQADTACRPERCRTGHFNRHEFLRALAIACDLLGEIDCHRLERPAKTSEPPIGRARHRRVSRLLGGAEEYRVAGRGVAVDGHAIERPV